MTQIGQNKLLALSNFSPHRFAIFSFLTILWLKMTQIFFWPRRWSKLKKLRFLAIKRQKYFFGPGSGQNRKKLRFSAKNTKNAIFAIKMPKKLGKTYFVSNKHFF